MTSIMKKMITMIYEEYNEKLLYENMKLLKRMKIKYIMKMKRNIFEYIIEEIQIQIWRYVCDMTKSKPMNVKKKYESICERREEKIENEIYKTKWRNEEEGNE